MATTNLYQNIAIHPQMTSNRSENTSRARSNKNMGTKMGLNQNSKQRGIKLSSKRTIEWCLEQAIPSDCDTILPNLRSSSIYDTFSTMNISDDESQFKTFPWQPVKQRSSPDIVDNPFLDPLEGPTNLPSAHSLYENSLDTSSSHRDNYSRPSSYQHLEILHYILLSGYSNSGKRTLRDFIKFLFQDMTRDDSWIYEKAIRSYILRCIVHTVWEMKKKSMFPLIGLRDMSYTILVTLGTDHLFRVIFGHIKASHMIIRQKLFINWLRLLGMTKDSERLLMLGQAKAQE